MKYYFSDEPQFVSVVDRKWTADYIRSLRNINNGNRQRYTVKRTNAGFSIRLNYPNSPTAIIAVL